MRLASTALRPAFRTTAPAVPLAGGNRHLAAAAPPVPAHGGSSRRRPTLASSGGREPATAGRVRLALLVAGVLLVGIAATAGGAPGPDPAATPGAAPAARAAAGQGERSPRRQAAGAPAADAGTPRGSGRAVGAGRDAGPGKIAASGKDGGPGQPGAAAGLTLRGGSRTLERIWWNQPRLVEALGLREEQRGAMDRQLVRFLADREDRVRAYHELRRRFTEEVTAGDWDAADGTAGEVAEVIGALNLGESQMRLAVMRRLDDGQRAALAADYPRLLVFPWVRSAAGSRLGIKGGTRAGAAGGGS